MTLCFCSSASVPKYFDAFAGRRNEITHVFDQAQNRHVHLLKHGNPFADHSERCLLGCGDNNAAIQRNSLAKRKLSIPCPGWQIYQKEIQLPPLDGANELLDRLHDHRSAPDNRLVAVQQKTHAHEFHAMIGRRHHFLLLADGRALLDSHHQRDAWSIDVTIQQTDTSTELIQGTRQINGKRRFTYPTFAAGHGDYSADARDLVLLCPGTRCARRSGSPLMLHCHIGFFHAGQGPQDLLAFCLNLLSDLRIAAGQLHGHADRAIAGCDPFDHAERNDIAAVAGILDGSERGLDVLFGNLTHVCLTHNRACIFSVNLNRGLPG